MIKFLSKALLLITMILLLNSCKNTIAKKELIIYYTDGTEERLEIVEKSY